MTQLSLESHSGQCDWSLGLIGSWAEYRVIQKRQSKYENHGSSIRTCKTNSINSNSSQVTYLKLRNTQTYESPKKLEYVVQRDHPATV